MSWLDFSSRPQVLLAPMDGITDPPFRRFAKRIAPNAVVFSEFLPATQVARKPSLAKTMFKIYSDEKPVVIQLYGKDAAHFELAASLAEAEGAAGVDINMGCPAKKVVAHRHGSALMRDIDLACEIVARVKGAVSVPVTVKTRLGWEDERNLIPFIRRLCDVGLDAVTIHGRTYSQKFDGEANYAPIYDLKRAIDIPVFGNGDVDSDAKALELLGPLDGLMIGRAAIADPWLLARVCLAFAGEPTLSVPSFRDKVPLWKSFAEMAVAHRPGSEVGACHSFRKFMVRLHRDLALDPTLRKAAVSVSSVEDIHRVLDQFVAASDLLPLAG